MGFNNRLYWHDSFNDPAPFGLIPPGVGRILIYEVSFVIGIEGFTGTIAK